MKMKSRVRSGESLNEFVRQHCAEHKITLDALAKMVGISRSTLYGLLREGGDAKTMQWIKLANAMQVHYTILLQLKYGNFNAEGLGVPDALYDACAFIDETIPDGSIVVAGQRFVKTWTIQNAGNQLWEGRRLMCVDLPIYGADTSSDYYELYHMRPDVYQVSIPMVKSGEKTTIAVVFTAPKVSGRYISYWKMINDKDEFCFPNNVGLSVCICVQGLGLAMKIAGNHKDDDVG